MNIKQVLIIDDSDADQFMAAAAIEEFDLQIEILQAYDGQEALELLDTLEKQPDLIFLDINMPRLNGFEFLAEYSTKEDRTSIVVMLTSSNQEKDKETARSYGCVKGYIEKPLIIQKIEEITKALETL